MNCLGKLELRKIVFCLTYLGRYRSFYNSFAILKITLSVTYAVNERANLNLFLHIMNTLLPFNLRLGVLFSGENLNVLLWMMRVLAKREASS